MVLYFYNRCHRSTKLYHIITKKEFIFIHITYCKVNFVLCLEVNGMDKGNGYLYSKTI